MEKFREVMRRWVTGVAVITAESRGVKHGMTVNSLASVSIDPPMIVVTLATNTRTHVLVVESGFFGLTLLAQAQQEVADRFAGRVPEEADRFLGLELTWLTHNVPVLRDGLAHLVCETEHTYSLPNSTLFVARVLDAEVLEDQPALVYANREYRHLENT